MGRLRIMPYGASKSAKALQKALKAELGVNVLRLKRNGTSNFRGRNGDTIINWGFRGNFGPIRGDANLLNIPSAIHNASNKLRCFNKLIYDCNYRDIPQVWTNGNEIPRTSFPVYCRTKVGSSQGRGIVVANSPEELVDAPLYTQGVGGKEYRFHVWNGRVIFTQQKKRMSSERLAEEGIESANEMVRNHKNGYIFACNSVDPVDQNVIDAATRAVNCLDLYFGAVDMRVENKYDEEQDEEYQKPYLLEVNTAPGLESESCIAAYVRAVRDDLYA